MAEENKPFETSETRSGRKSSLVGPLGTLKLDPKKRLTLPAKWREKHGHPSYVYVTQNEFEKCLDVFAPVVVEEKLAEASPKGDMATSEDRKKWAGTLRSIMAAFRPVDVDAQGRIRISDGLIAYAELTNYVSANALGSRMELWKAEKSDEEMPITQEAKTVARDALKL